MRDEFQKPTLQVERLEAKAESLAAEAEGQSRNEIPTLGGPFLGFL